jgi:hypothetical protein
LCKVARAFLLGAAGLGVGWCYRVPLDLKLCLISASNMLQTSPHGAARRGEPAS